MDKKRLLTLISLGVGVIVLSASIFFLLKPEKNNQQIEQEVLIENVVEEVNYNPYKTMFTINYDDVNFNDIKDNDLKNIQSTKDFKINEGKLFENDVNNIIFIENQVLQISESEQVSENELENELENDLTNENPTEKDLNLQQKQKIKLNHYGLLGNEYVDTEYLIDLAIYDDIIGTSLIDDEIIFITQETIDNIPYNNIYKFNTKETTKEIEKISIKNLESEKAFIYENNLYSFFDTKIRKTNLETLESEILNLGEKFKDYYIINDKLYVHNQFGSGNNNSLLFELNLNTFRVDNLFETKDSRVFVKGIDLLNNKLYFQSKNVKIEDLLEKDDVRRGFKIIELDLTDMKTNLVIDSVIEYEELISSTDLIFNNEFFIVK